MNGTKIKEKRERKKEDFHRVYPTDTSILLQRQLEKKERDRVLEYLLCRFHERKAEEEEGEGRGTPDRIDASRGIPHFARPPAECPGRDAPLSLAPGHRSHSAPPLSSSGTPCKVTSDCREDSRRRVLNKDPRRLNYPHP